ncbi:MAG: serine protease [Bacteroidetes bacterium]|jgi:hypothetical protein|nr:serine protease [Bacteroidota bacterium]
MRKAQFFILSIVIVVSGNLRADEGMWLLPLLEKLNMAKMQEMGLELSADEIYQINQSSLKDAIVIFGGGCTGEIISDKGLLLTNHHCGYDQIQEHSTVDNDLLSDGFWAEELEDELPNPDLEVRFLVRMENVTDSVLAAVNEDMKESVRQHLIDSVILELEEGLELEDYHEASIKSFFGGNQYYLSIYSVYPDVRLVGTPPSSIGKFGADTDNWMWPRHTGDFCLFRVYADKEGNPAKYSEENVPLKPKYHLPISLNGIEKGDFTMILGYPGGTDRYMTSYEVKELQEITHPNRIQIRGKRLEILDEAMQSDPAIRIQYASKYSRSSNYHKFSIGQKKGLERLDIYEKKQKLEKEFINWYKQDSLLNHKYEAAVTLIEEAVKERRPYKHASQYLVECFYYASEICQFPLKAQELAYLLNNKPDSVEQIKMATKRLKEEAKEFYKDYHKETDKSVTKAMLRLYNENIPEAYYPGFIKTINDKYDRNYQKYVDKLYDKSIFATEESFNEFLEKPSIRKLQGDMAYEMMNQWRDIYSQLYMLSGIPNRKYEKGHRLFIAGLQEMFPDSSFYPDANFTQRLTYGKVDDYFPEDAVYYDFHTTLKGVMEKEDPDNWEFEVPEKLKELYNQKDYGQYSQNDTLWVCFISDNDITGGNSGSPVLNSKGQLIGIAFDGNWEAMSGDVVFEPELQRTISVDIRYVLFIIDKFANAQRIIDELTIVSN